MIKKSLVSFMEIVNSEVWVIQRRGAASLCFCAGWWIHGALLCALVLFLQRTELFVPSLAPKLCMQTPLHQKYVCDYRIYHMIHYRCSVIMLLLPFRCYVCFVFVQGGYDTHSGGMKGKTRRDSGKHIACIISVQSIARLAEFFCEGVDDFPAGFCVSFVGTCPMQTVEISC
jgi:hypothetical protein